MNQADAFKDADLDALAKVLDGPTPDPKRESCDVFWGSHGCDLDKDHEGVWHICDFVDPCSAVMKWTDESVIAVGIANDRADWVPCPQLWKLY